MTSKKLEDRDVEKTYSSKQFVEKIRRLADCVEQGKKFVIQVAGESIHVPNGAIFNIEHERENDREEIEFQIKWCNKTLLNNDKKEGK